MPVRQWRETTLPAIDSLLKQSLTSFEIILITQPTDDHIENRLPDDPRIKLVKRIAPGIVSALNTGLSEARGQYIARMDDDDIAYPQRLESQLAHLQTHQHIDICGCKIRFVTSDGTHSNVAHGNRSYQRWLNALTEPEDIRVACYRESPLPHPTLMAHRSVWDSLEGYRDLDGPEDYDLLLRAMLAGFRMGKPDVILQDWREHRHRLTYTDNRYRRQAFVERAAWASVQPSSQLGLDAGRRVWICGTGRRARDWHDALVDHGVTVQGFVDKTVIDSQRRKRGLPVIDYETLAISRKQSLVVFAITQDSARPLLASFCHLHGWVNGKDYIVGG